MAKKTRRPVRVTIAYTLANTEGYVDLDMMARRADLVRKWAADIYGEPWSNLLKEGVRVTKVRIIPI